MPVLSHGSLTLSLGCYIQCHSNHTQTPGASDPIYSEQLCSQLPLRLSDELFKFHVAAHTNYYLFV